MDFDLTEEQCQLRDAARKLAQSEFRDRPRAGTARKLFPGREQAPPGRTRLPRPERRQEYGGSGAGLVGTYLVIEELAKVDLLTAMIVHDQNVSPRIIANHGSVELKRRLVPRFVSGELECSIAWTEPQAGSDGTAIRTAAVRDGDEVLINGSKIFTTFGDRADMHLVYARFGPSQRRQGHRHHRGRARPAGPDGHASSKARWACAARPRTSCSSTTCACRRPTS